MNFWKKLFGSSSVDKRDKAGNTPLILAADGGHVQTVKDLLQNGADVNAQAHDGASATQLAAGGGYAEIVRLLTDKGADACAQNSDGVTALFLASQNGYTDIVTLILSKGANPNVSAKDGFTPLMAAAKNGHLNVVSILLANGADSTLESSIGIRAEDIAYERGHNHVCDEINKAAISLPRKFGSKYKVDGWTVDGSTDVHLSVLFNVHVFGFSGGEGCVLRVSHEPPIVELHKVHIRGVTACPRCSHPQHFIATIEKNGRGTPSAYVNRCMKCDVLADVNIPVLEFSSTASEFYLTSRRHRESYPTAFKGPWTPSSAGIDSIRVFDRDSTSQEDHDHSCWLQNRGK